MSNTNTPTYWLPAWWADEVPPHRYPSPPQFATGALQQGGIATAADATTPSAHGHGGTITGSGGPPSPPPAAAAATVQVPEEEWDAIQTRINEAVERRFIEVAPGLKQIYRGL